MKRIFAPLGVLSVLALFAAQASAAVTIISASGAAPSVDGWAIATTGGGPAGEFGGADPNLNTGGGAASIVAGPPAWGIFATPGSTTVADFGFPALAPGGFASIDFDNPGIAPGATVGVQFLTGGSGGVLAFEYIFTGGGASWLVGDAGGFGLPSGTGFSPDGFTFTLASTGPGTYTFSDGVTAFGGGLAGGALTVDTIRIADFGNNVGPGDDVIFNTLTFDPVPEPSRAMLLLLGAAGFVVRRRR